ncbi:hypothetical protein NIES2109_53180 [Nostoc sp. HK-01]|nr:hypothetical protein NIES2109_53180 [Nostoc sp. HK-01]
MAKRPKSGKCVHCLQNFNNLTRDHVFPSAWYPDNTPENVQRWTIPSCRECNNEYGKLEEDMLLKLGLCINPEYAKSSGITEKALRSIDPEYATDRKEKRIRQRKRDKVIKEIVKFKVLPHTGVYPNFRSYSNLYYPEYLSILISSKQIERLCHKIVRGITYIIDNTFIEENFNINFFPVEDKDVRPILESLQKGLEKYELPGIKVVRAMADDDRNAGFYAIEIWDQLKMYAIVI